MKKSKKHLLLFSNCVPVKGAKRSTIVDLQRKKMYFIDNSFYDILMLCREKNWDEIKADFDITSKRLLEKFVTYLQEHELCFWTSSPDNFPLIDFSWESPATITNAIVDSNCESRHNWKMIFDKLTIVGCRDIQCRFFDELATSELERILEYLEGSYFKSIEIYLKFEKILSKRYLDKLIEIYTRIKSIVVHSSPQDEIYRFRNDTGASGMGNIIFIKQRITSNEHCGVIDPMYFSLGDVQTFSEFKNYNSCLNRKIGIDVNGDIKNCPSLSNIYGNINYVSISDILTDEFKTYWYQTKDQIDTCKICEFRYVCSECRAFLSDPLNPNSKPLKCSYDPVKMEWG
jgi:SPASM domain peptide maturase of grasp-with-spasm system